MAIFSVNVSENVTSQDLSNEVSYVGVSETFITSTCLRVGGLKLYGFT